MVFPGAPHSEVLGNSEMVRLSNDAIASVHPPQELLEGIKGDYER